MVKAEQEAAERQLEKEEEERKRKREEAKRRKRMLEAAFDGDVDEMKVVLKEVPLFLRKFLFAVIFFLFPQR